MLHECSRIVDFENSERLTGKVENVMRSMSWVLTHSLLGIFFVFFFQLQGTYLQYLLTNNV